MDNKNVNYIKTTHIYYMKLIFILTQLNSE